jgi:hypothetical protein
LIILLAEDKEDRVQEFDELAEVKDPPDPHHSHCIRVIGSINWLAFVVILPEPAIDTEEPEEIAVQ